MGAPDVLTSFSGESFLAEVTFKTFQLNTTRNSAAIAVSFNLLGSLSYVIIFFCNRLEHVSKRRKKLTNLIHVTYGYVDKLSIYKRTEP